MKLLPLLSLVGLLHGADIIDVYVMPGSEALEPVLKRELVKAVDPKLYAINWADVSRTPASKGAWCAYISCVRVAGQRSVISVSLTMQRYGGDATSLEVGLTKPTSDAEVQSDAAGLIGDVSRIAFSNMDKVSGRIQP